MQEQINEKTVALTVRGGKLTAHMLARALSKLLRDMKQQHSKAVNKTYKGKQTVKQLVRQGAGVSNIEITDGNIKAFEGVARKYGVDFALQKVEFYPDTDAGANSRQSQSNGRELAAAARRPKWLVFFKAKDADALTAAFSEFTAKTLNRSAEKPSVVALLRKTLEKVKNQVVDRTKAKRHEGPEL